MHLSNGIRFGKLLDRAPNHADRHRQQQHTQHQGSGVFITAVTVRMAFVGFFLAVATGNQHHKIG